MKSDGKSGDLYVVRGGAGHGIHKTWAAALNAGWYQKQAFGNCCKFSSSEMKDAEDFLAHEMFPEGRAGAFAKDMRQQHILVRVFALGVITTIFRLDHREARLHRARQTRLSFSAREHNAPMHLRAQDHRGGHRTASAHLQPHRRRNHHPRWVRLHVFRVVDLRNN